MRLAYSDMARGFDRLLGHWLPAAALILVAAALTIPQIDQYPLSLDAIFSYTLALGLTESPYTAIDVLENLARIDPNQAPLHHILLHFWGNVAGHSLAAARLPALFAGLLSLAMVYRLASDFVSPIAGFFASVVMLCNAFYAFYYAHVRYYTLIVLLAALIVWLYLHILTRPQQSKKLDYLALLLACYALISTHFFGFVLYATLSLYHLLAVRKDRHWLAIVATTLIALLLAAPWLSVMLTDGVERSLGHHAERAASVGLSDILATWLTVISNGSQLLLVVSLVGIVAGWRKKLLRGNPFLLFFPLLAISIGLASEVSGIVSEGQMRYMLVGTPIVVGFLAAGLFALYRLRRWLGLLALLWLAAGLSFMRTADWEHLIGGRTWAYTHPPWQLLSRWQQESSEEFAGLTVGVSHKILHYGPFQPGHLRHFYFGQHGISLHKSSEVDIDELLGESALERPGYWILFQRGVTDTEDVGIVVATLEKYGYEPCEEQDFPNHSVLYTYRWKSLHCEPQPKTAIHADAGAYQHYGTHHDGSKLLFTGAWLPAVDANADRHALSFQLIDADWENHAQIDLPTSSLSDMRQLIFDLSNLPPGDYRLMTIVYDAQTGERLAWHDNVGWVPEMQQLAEITIPD